MAVLNVNPTRMELRRLKARLKTAVRGHKLLKDKSDEMIRRFLISIKENRSLRLEVEKELSLALKNFMLARAVSSDAVIEEAIAYPSVSAELETSTANVMSVNVPTFKASESTSKDLYPYSFASVTSELDFSISTLSSLLTKMLRLAEIEKTCNMLADEIEKNKGGKIVEVKPCFNQLRVGYKDLHTLVQLFLHPVLTLYGFHVLL